MFMHGSTFGGHPVRPRRSENIRIIERERLLEHVRNLEGYFEGELRRLAERHPLVKEIRGIGFFWAVEVNAERADGTPSEGDEYERYFMRRLPGSFWRAGLICRFDDKDAPVIQFSPRS